MEKRFDTKLIVALIINVTFWASAFVAIRAAVQHYSPAQVSLFRLLISSAVLGIYSLLVKIRLPEKCDILPIAGAALIGISFYNWILGYGEMHVTAGSASMLVNTVPVWTALMAVIFLKEHLNMWGWLGILTSFIGATIISWGEGSGFSLSKESGAVFLAALAQSLFFILQKPYLDKYRVMEFAAYVIWLATLSMLPFGQGLVTTIKSAPGSATAAVVFLGAGPGAVGFISWTYILSRIPASRAVGFLYIVPLLTIFLAWLWLGEIPHLLSFAGGAIALAGVVLLNTLGQKRN